jgi:hypothetical protein
MNMELSTETKARPNDPLLRKYAVTDDGIVNFLESWVSPGNYLAQRLDHAGQPLDSMIVTTRELKRCSLLSNLREARSRAAVNFYRHSRMKATLGDLI